MITDMPKVGSLRRHEASMPWQPQAREWFSDGYTI